MPAVALEHVALIDCEASSLREDSYPIEVGWCLASTGEVESHLIVPHEGWHDWDAEAEAVHGIGRRTLLEEGLTVGTVAQRMREALGGLALYADGTRDQRWIDRLFDAAGLPSLTLGHFDELLDAIVGSEMGSSGGWLPRELARARDQSAVIDEAYARARLSAPPTHRAGADA